MALLREPKADVSLSFHYFVLAKEKLVITL